MMYGLLGLIPFLVPPLIPVIAPVLTDCAERILSLYGALILSFLGGARWGLAVIDPVPAVKTVSLAMLPTLVGFGLLMLSISNGRLSLLGLAAALVMHWVWDLSGDNLPGWYPRLRTILTVGAVAGLLAGAFSLT